MWGGGVLEGDWVGGGEGRLRRAVGGWRAVGREVGGTKEWDGAGVVGGVRGGVRCGWWVRVRVGVCGHGGGCGEIWVRMILMSSCHL